MGNLITAIKNSIPLLLVYIFAAVPADIIKNSGVANNLAKNILPSSVSPNFKYLALFSIFGLSVLFTFLIDSTAISSALVASLAPALVASSESVLIYAAVFA